MSVIRCYNYIGYKFNLISNYCLKLVVCYEKISNIRCDYLHKVSHKTISENQVIITEDLQVKNMIKNRKLASSIADVS